jgi:hypothetical protein
MNELAIDYFVLVFLATLGVIQIAASRSGLQGILFFKRPLYSVMFGLLLIVAGFVFFFSEPRNIPDTAGGLDGNGQALYFAIAAGAAVALTYILSSVRNTRWAGDNGPTTSGLDALRETTYLRALLNSLKGLWKRFSQ